MKVRSLLLENFKQFQNKTLDFVEPTTAKARGLIVLVGANGSGKSTVLQALAATLGCATQRLRAPRELDWPGFDSDLVGSAWRRPAKATVQVEFSPDELDATRDYYQTVASRAEGTMPTTPGNEEVAELTWTAEHGVRAVSAQQYFQFRGRDFARQVFKEERERRDLFETVGSVYWYHEHRKTTSLSPSDVVNGEAPVLTEEVLRRRLADWFVFHERVRAGHYALRPGQRDFMSGLMRAWCAVFPDRTLDGPVPRGGDELLDEPYFYLCDGRHQYEISELSAGERAIFPMLVDFANLGINKSVVLIDEIELHLHPPLQQALLRSLPKLGIDNQFIITTHSDHVVSIAPEDAVVRLDDLP